MDLIQRATKVIGLIFCIWLLTGCAEVLVPGAFTGAGEYYHYTTNNVGRKTLMGNVDQVTAATRSALKKMDIGLRSVNPEGSEIEIAASARELDITIHMVPITAATTKVTVQAVKDHVIKDKATAAEILSQIQIELDGDTSLDEAYPKIFVKNDCRHPIDVIVYYLAGKNEPETWKKSGWLSLSPGQKKYAADTHNRYIYFYGESRFEDKLVWTGDILQWFEGRRYGFFRVDMGKDLANFTQTFSCD
jgi:hypothetical protein